MQRNRTILSSIKRQNRDTALKRKRATLESTKDNRITKKIKQHNTYRTHYQVTQSSNGVKLFQRATNTMSQQSTAHNTPLSSVKNTMSRNTNPKTDATQPQNIPTIDKETIKNPVAQKRRSNNRFDSNRRTKQRHNNRFDTIRRKKISKGKAMQNGSPLYESTINLRSSVKVRGFEREGYDVTRRQVTVTRVRNGRKTGTRQATVFRYTPKSNTKNSSNITTYSGIYKNQVSQRRQQNAQSKSVSGQGTSRFA